MSNQKNTPGPWKYDGGPPIVLDSAGRIVANVITMDPLFPGALPVDANARLIAAAPELLEAALLLDSAETAHANCDECEAEWPPELCGSCSPLFDEARLKRRAAIAKAEGRS